MPAVSVIFVNWNSGPWLARACAALDRQTCQDFEVIVVDNASADDSLAQATACLPRLQALPQQRNLGFAAANNLAVTTARGYWLAFLNPDAVPEPAWIEQLLAATRAFPDHAFFGSCQVMAATPERLDGIGDAYHVSGLAWRIGYGASSALAPERPMEIFSPCAAAALYRRDLFLAAGGFDERYFCYLEDVDLGFRCRLRGARAMYVPGAIVRHAGSASTGRHSDFTVYHSQRNLVWTFVKNMPFPLLLAYLPLHLALNLVAIVHFSLKGQGVIVLKAKWDALRGLPAVMRDRRALQASRRVRAGSLLAQMARGWPKRYRF